MAYGELNSDYTFGATVIAWVRGQGSALAVAIFCGCQHTIRIILSNHHANHLPALFQAHPTDTARSSSHREIGRASCRERVEMWGAAALLKTNNRAVMWAQVRQ